MTALFAEPFRQRAVAYARGGGGRGVRGSTPPPIDHWEKIKTVLFVPISLFSYRDCVFMSNQIKSSLYSPYYAETCNELRGPSPRLSAWATQLRRNVATVASRWRRCADLTGPRIEPQTSRTDSLRFATELTAGCVCFYVLYQIAYVISRNFHCDAIIR